MSPQEAFATAVQKAGGQANLGRKVGTSQQRVWYHLSKGHPMPAEWVLAAEQATGVPKHLIRPDIFAAPAEAE
ncbi:hypothetical protein M527_29330 [Sphingobium indicum IP26]|nr:YdaS family helix-turn-helix protein [Sphingobium sp. HDIP04]EPR14213.1 hypothetical protein M527_29330 [Sphingobium indicum IP26]